ncbi:MAG: 2,3,4,5-tetrahydropyridine-2,6-dicarboxylate N-succinyltransferase [Actinomycetota bacterium]|jgi:2,3,4,5-tetrahydropyridine-2-carboxylate N-succinyltransferase
MKNISELKAEFEKIAGSGNPERSLAFFYEVREALESGQLRVAYKSEGGWVINSWVKSVILWGFKYGVLKEYRGEPLSFRDKNTYPVRSFRPDDGIRVVPGGTSVRSGAYVAPGTVIMPPSYVNTGAYIDSGCMIDSHALVGSCAQIGRNVHISAGSQIGGVLEPVNAMPVIIEDNVFVGGNCGIYEGAIIGERAVIGTGVIINGSTPVFDNTTGEFLRKSESTPLSVPAGAVVVAGSRPVRNGPGSDQGIHLYCPVIIKYRDQKTSASTALEELLR